jgi:CRISPR-associated exonuclease Cas4
MFSEAELLPLSALQHWLFCPRQCGLIHLEQAWAENRFTAEGRVLHEKAHDGPDETRAGVRITRGLPVRSLTLGISGQCDVVEFHASGDLRFEISNLKSAARVVPVEYKRGKPKSHRADEVQVCAQALCLEEMLGIAIDSGCLYYGEKRRRTEVVFDPELRELVIETAAALHAMIAARQTPLAEYEPRRCDACSLIDECLPKTLRFKRGAAAWFRASLRESQI